MTEEMKLSYNPIFISSMFFYQSWRLLSASENIGLSHSIVVELVLYCCAFVFLKDGMKELFPLIRDKEVVMRIKIIAILYALSIILLLFSIAFNIFTYLL